MPNPALITRGLLDGSDEEIVRLATSSRPDLDERHGVGELWLADTASRTMLVHRRSAPRSGFDLAC